MTDLEVADGDESRSASDGELVLLGRPLDAGRGAVDPQEHEGVLPSAIGLKVKKTFQF